MKLSEMKRLFRAKAEAVQSVVKTCPGAEKAFRYACALAKDQGGAVVAAPGWSDEEARLLNAICGEYDLTCVTQDLRSHLDSIHLGITCADAAIADTGTLVIDSTSEDIRIATMLCHTHIALLSPANLYPDSESYAAQMTAMLKKAPCYAAFITGPSRTADIERVLTIGVHGPQELHILIMEEENEDAAIC